EPAPELGEVGPVGHQPAGFHVVAPGIHRRQAALLDQINDQLTVGKKLTNAAYEDRVRRILRYFSETTLILGVCRLMEQHIGQRDLQSSARRSELFLQLLPLGTFPGPAHIQESDPRSRRDGFLEDLQALSIDLEPCVDGDAGDVADW